MSWIRNWKDRRAVAKWEGAGRPVPPPEAFKQQNLREFAQRFGLDVLVETGTYKGEMVRAVKDDFRKLYSIEQADEFFEAAVQRFWADEKINILNGESGRVLEKLVPKLDGPTLFWLDGHNAAGDIVRGARDTPVIEELEHIFAREDLRCAILIDDARCFDGQRTPIYPSSSEVRALVAERRPGWTFEVATDCIRITPPE